MYIYPYFLTNGILQFSSSLIKRLVQLFATILCLSVTSIPISIGMLASRTSILIEMKELFGTGIRTCILPNDLNYPSPNLNSVSDRIRLNVITLTLQYVCACFFTYNTCLSSSVYTYSCKI